jgi:hypothetical protein
MSAGNMTLTFVLANRVRGGRASELVGADIIIIIIIIIVCNSEIKQADVQNNQAV